MSQALTSETAARAEEILSLDVEDLDLERRRARVVSKGGALEYVHWVIATARLLPRLLAGRTAGPVFLADRRCGCRKFIHAGRRLDGRSCATAADIAGPPRHPFCGGKAGATATFLIRDRDAKFTAAFDAVLTDAAIQVVTTGIRIPRMNSIMERWIWNQRHLLHTLRELETFYNEHRPQRTLRQAAPLDHHGLDVWPAGWRHVRITAGGSVGSG